MGLDIDIFAANGEPLVSFHNHHRLLRYLVSPTDDTPDFFLDAYDIKDLLDEIEGEMKRAGLTPAPVDIPAKASFDDVLETLPRDFCGDEPEDGKAALAHYWTLFTHLQVIAKENDYVRCGWSA